MKKKFLILTALLAVSAACFAGCADNETRRTNSTAPEQNTKIVLTEEEKSEENIPETEEPAEPEKDERPDGKCPPKGMPCPRHDRRHPRPVKYNK